MSCSEAQNENEVMVRLSEVRTTMRRFASLDFSEMMYKSKLEMETTVRKIS